MLWVERDLAAVCKAVFDNWGLRKDELNHQYLFASSVWMSYNELVAIIEKGDDNHRPYARLTLHSDWETYQVYA